MPRKYEYNYFCRVQCFSEMEQTAMQQHSNSFMQTFKLRIRSAAYPQKPPLYYRGGKCSDNIIVICNILGILYQKQTALIIQVFSEAKLSYLIFYKSYYIFTGLLNFFQYLAIVIVIYCSKKTILNFSTNIYKNKRSIRN